MTKDEILNMPMDIISQIQKDQRKSLKIRTRKSSFPRVLPPFWREFPSPNYLRIFVKAPHKVLLSDEYYDGAWWTHLSISTQVAIPSWEALREAKDTFIGRDRKAIQVLPPASEYVNFHPFVLHLWSLLSGDLLPDFTAGENTL